MTGWPLADGVEGRLSAIRVDPSGRVVVEDAARGVRQRLDPESAMRAVLEAGLAPSPEAAPDVMSDWIDKGWRPSLEYLLWSERGTVNDVQVSAGRADGERSVGIGEAGPHDAAGGKVLTLPAPSPNASGRGVAEVLLRRRTVRSFDARPMVAADVAGMLVDPSAALGAGVSLRLVAYDIAGVPSGVWTVAEDGRSLVASRSGSFRDEMSALMCGMPAARTAGATVVVVVDMPQRQRAHPYERALRELYVDIGRIGQRLIFEAESRTLGCLITPATNDRELTALLGLRRGEYPVYTLTVGHRLRHRVRVL